MSTSSPGTTWRALAHSRLHCHRFVLTNDVVKRRLAPSASLGVRWQVPRASQLSHSLLRQLVVQMPKEIVVVTEAADQAYTPLPSPPRSSRFQTSPPASPRAPDPALHVYDAARPNPRTARTFRARCNPRTRSPNVRVRCTPPIPSACSNRRVRRYTVTLRGCRMRRNCPATRGTSRAH